MLRRGTQAAGAARLDRLTNEEYESLPLAIVAMLPLVGFARNDVWLGNRYSVALTFGADELGKKNAPTPKSVPLPEYPSTMIRAAIRGEAVLDYTVAADGTTAAIVIVKATAEEFGKSAAAAARNWVFNPAIDLASGNPVPARMRCKVRFSITEEDSELPLEPGR